jgi:plasmid stability protein
MPSQHAQFLWYCETVKNITISVPDDVYRVARVRAAEQGSSVSALVRGYLQSLSDEEAEFARLEAQQREVMDELAAFRGGDRLERDAVHDRALR